MPKPRRTSDATLVRRSQQGDRRAFSALLSRYDWRLRGLAHALLLDRSEMDTALATGYLRAWRDVVRVDPKEDVAAWLYRVTYNACIDQLRRAETAPGAGAGSGPGHAAGRQHSGIAAGLATLPPAERVAVVLVDREGFSPSSAARILGLAEPALSATLDSARERLIPHIPEPGAPGSDTSAAGSADAGAASVDDPDDEAAALADDPAPVAGSTKVAPATVPVAATGRSGTEEAPPAPAASGDGRASSNGRAGGSGNGGDAGAADEDTAGGTDSIATGTQGSAVPIPAPGGNGSRGDGDLATADRTTAVTRPGNGTAAGAPGGVAPGSTAGTAGAAVRPDNGGTADAVTDATGRGRVDGVDNDDAGDPAAQVRPDDASAAAATGAAAPASTVEAQARPGDGITDDTTGHEAARRAAPGNGSAAAGTGDEATGAPAPGNGRTADATGGPGDEVTADSRKGNGAKTGGRNRGKGRRARRRAEHAAGQRLADGPAASPDDTT